MLRDGRNKPGKRVNGKLPKVLGVYVENNGNVDYGNLDLFAYFQNKKSNKPTWDITEITGSLPRLPKITIPGDRESTD